MSSIAPTTLLYQRYLNEKYSVLLRLDKNGNLRVKVYEMAACLFKKTFNKEEMQPIAIEKNLADHNFIPIIDKIRKNPELMPFFSNFTTDCMCELQHRINQLRMAMNTHHLTIPYYTCPLTQQIFCQPVIDTHKYKTDEYNHIFEKKAIKALLGKNTLCPVEQQHHIVAEELVAHSSMIGEINKICSKDTIPTFALFREENNEEYQILKDDIRMWAKVENYVAAIQLYWVALQYNKNWKEYEKLVALYVKLEDWNPRPDLGNYYLDRNKLKICLSCLYLIQYQVQAQQIAAAIQTLNQYKQYFDGKEIILLMIKLSLEAENSDTNRIALNFVKEFIKENSQESIWLLQQISKILVNEFNREIKVDFMKKIVEHNLKMLAQSQNDNIKTTIGNLLEEFINVNPDETLWLTNQIFGMNIDPANSEIIIILMVKLILEAGNNDIKRISLHFFKEFIKQNPSKILWLLQQIGKIPINESNLGIKKIELVKKLVKCNLKMLAQPQNENMRTNTAKIVEEFININPDETLWLTKQIYAMEINLDNLEMIVILMIKLILKAGKNDTHRIRIALIFFKDLVEQNSQKSMWLIQQISKTDVNESNPGIKKIELMKKIVKYNLKMLAQFQDENRKKSIGNLIEEFINTNPEETLWLAEQVSQRQIDPTNLEIIVTLMIKLSLGTGNSDTKRSALNFVKELIEKNSQTSILLINQIFKAHVNEADQGVKVELMERIVEHSLIMLTQSQDENMKRTIGNLIEEFIKVNPDGATWLEEQISQTPINPTNLEMKVILMNTLLSTMQQTNGTKFRKRTPHSTTK